MDSIAWRLSLLDVPRLGFLQLASASRRNRGSEAEAATAKVLALSACGRMWEVNLSTWKQEAPRIWSANAVICMEATGNPPTNLILQEQGFQLGLHVLSQARAQFAKTSLSTTRAQARTAKLSTPWRCSRS